MTTQGTELMEYNMGNISLEILIFKCIVFSCLIFQFEYSDFSVGIRRT